MYIEIERAIPKQIRFLRYWTTIIALVPEKGFMNMNKIAVPGKELADVVNDQSEVLVESR